MSGPLATQQDVADIWRPLSTDEQTQAGNLIIKASALLRKALPFDLDQRIALAASDPTSPQALDLAVVAVVVATVVKRVMANPDAAVAVSETVGPFSSSTTFANRYNSSGSGSALGALAIEPADIQALLPTPGFQLPQTIMTRPRHHRHHHDLPLLLP